VKKLLADAQRIGAEQEAKAKKAAEKKKTAEKKKAAESKTVEKPDEKSRLFKKSLNQVKRRKENLSGKDQGSRRPGHTSSQLARRLRVFPFASSLWQ
jgi:hypothetical protein